MKYIVFDIDNTLADQTEREKAATINGKLDWGIFQKDELMYDDKPIWQTIKILDNLKDSYKIIIVTARKEQNRQITIDWLNKWLIKYDKLYTRKDCDFRSDVEFKEELYEAKLKDLDIFCVFDDRPRIVKMWQSKGLYTFECNNRKGDW